MTTRTAFILSLISLIALVVRGLFFNFESGDFTDHVGPWLTFLRDNGGFEALKYGFSNYNVTFLYLLAAASYLPSDLPTIYVIKSISIIFDLACAGFVYRLVALKFESSGPRILAFALALMAPTVVTNSGLWGQSDSIYTAGVLACIYFWCVRRPNLASVCFGMALTVKLQAMFLAPLLFILFIRRELRFSAVCLIPMVYLGMLLPAFFIGRPLDELLLIYAEQAGWYEDLTKNAPNLYQWFPDADYSTFVLLGTGVTCIAFCALSILLYRHDHEIDVTTLIALATLVLMLAPFLLPKMHERYFYPADLMTIVFAFNFPRLWIVPVLMIGSSFLSYLPYLFGASVLPLNILAGMVLLNICLVARQSSQMLFRSE